MSVIALAFLTGCGGSRLSKEEKEIVGTWKSGNGMHVFESGRAYSLKAKSNTGKGIQLDTGTWRRKDNEIIVTKVTPYKIIKVTPTMLTLGRKIDDNIIETSFERKDKGAGKNEIVGTWQYLLSIFDFQPNNDFINTTLDGEVRGTWERKGDEIIINTTTTMAKIIKVTPTTLTLSMNGLELNFERQDNK